nr:MAG TPA: hypothetical protein [Crassvirales sp.]
MNDNNYKTLPIGTIFTYNGNKYQVCKYYINDLESCCTKCAFYFYDCIDPLIKSIRGNCFTSVRADNNNVYYKLITDKDNKEMDKDMNKNIIFTFKDNNNSLNDLHIECLKGYSIDVDNSDLSKGIIKFKNDTITFKDIYKDIDINIDKFANSIVVVNNNNPYYNKLEAISQLIDIANYYNKGWKPDWNNEEENKYHIVFDFYYNIYRVKVCAKTSVNVTYFAHEEDAKSVIDNPNFKDILDDIYKN